MTDIHHGQGDRRGRIMGAFVRASGPPLPTGEEIHLRRATPADIAGVSGLLQQERLPLAGISPTLAHFVVATVDQRVIGTAGLEHYGAAALLRSVVVAPDARSCGVARLLVDRLAEEARVAGVTDLFLLTTTAEAYFAARGFTVTTRDAVPDGVSASAELRGACPATAIVMHRAL